MPLMLGICNGDLNINSRTIPRGKEYEIVVGCSRYNAMLRMGKADLNTPIEKAWNALFTHEV